jgi:transposase
MDNLSSQLPEYETVMNMYGVGTVLGSQLIAEIGDISRLKSSKSLIALAGIDPPPNQSGQVDVKSRSISKRGSPSLRKTLFQIMQVIIQNQPADEPVYQFLDRKRSEGKPYRVYMIAAANKFLRIYYARVNEALNA